MGLEARLKAGQRLEFLYALDLHFKPFHGLPDINLWPYFRMTYLDVWALEGVLQDSKGNMREEATKLRLKSMLLSPPLALSLADGWLLVIVHMCSVSVYSCTESAPTRQRRRSIQVLWDRSWKKVSVFISHPRLLRDSFELFG